MKGEVKRIMDYRGYGFISSDDIDGDIFFHYTELKNINFNELKVGHEVEFEIREDPRGPQAENIMVI